MTLEERKDHILKLVKTGLGFFEAALIAEASDDDISTLEQDSVFQRRIQAQHALEEKRMLQQLDTAIDIAVVRGQSSGAQWKLERLNPKRWASKSGNNTDEQIPTDISVYLTGVFPDGSRN